MRWRRERAHPSEAAFLPAYGEQPQEEKSPHVQPARAYSSAPACPGSAQCLFLDKTDDPGRTRANWQQVWKLLSSLASHAERKVKKNPNGRLGIN